MSIVGLDMRVLGQVCSCQGNSVLFGDLLSFWTAKEKTGTCNYGSNLFHSKEAVNVLERGLNLTAEMTFKAPVMLTLH